MAKKAVTVLMAVLFFATMRVYAAFSDDFTDEAASNTNWSSASESVNIQFSNGNCI